VNGSTWTWISGNNTMNLAGIYGQKGNTSIDSVPGGRGFGVGMYNNVAREFWLFGGYGYASVPDLLGACYIRKFFFNAKLNHLKGHLNDLWKYRVDDSKWTWISGSEYADQAGEYGGKGSPSTHNIPGARSHAPACYGSSTQENFLCLVALALVLRVQVREYFTCEITYDAGPNHTIPSLNIGNNTGYLNDFWKLAFDFCPPLYQNINNTCVSLIQCSSENDQTSCELKCNHDSSVDEPACVINGDVTVNGSIVETQTIAIVGVINVTGSVILTDNVTVTLTPGATLHVGQCLLLEEDSEILVLVESGDSDTPDERKVLATYNSSCSSPNLLERMKVKPSPSLDECRGGRPTVQQQQKDGRTQLELMFVPLDSSECGSGVNVLAIAIAVPIAVVVLVVVIVVMTVPKLRNKVFPLQGEKNKLFICNNKESCFGGRWDENWF